MLVNRCFSPQVSSIIDPNVSLRNYLRGYSGILDRKGLISFLLAYNKVAHSLPFVIGHGRGSVSNNNTTCSK